MVKCITAKENENIILFYWLASKYSIINYCIHNILFNFSKKIIIFSVNLIKIDRQP